MPGKLPLHLLEAALIGLEHQRINIERLIAEVKGGLRSGGQREAGEDSPRLEKQKRRLSAEARESIGAAQRKRWAKQKGAAKKATAGAKRSSRKAAKSLSKRKRLASAEAAASPEQSAQPEGTEAAAAVAGS